ncbi:hypothetical protein HanXRQr2_Chr02g0049351 [Helianthus annuus]|uniref:Uncharacterized protein n=1 Tax=Helianthus annuus TaxID=4232 RepID=A0A251VFE9_HELAN|nr:uncharacterized protein LOC110902233 [Helianthus annuus]KAF5817125.1 hypothetical protein HanXRQr2_Chr02g0049351 [Helianthus annuus]KAJ0950479.1 hypothetical protein HanPSC8_Chr02g0048731 [Helianthus annuus]
MKSKSLAFIFLLLVAQYISCLAFESKEEKGSVHMKGNSYVREDGVKRDELVLSKAGKGKGAYGGQNDRPPDIRKSKAVSMLLKEPAYMSKVGVIIINIMLVYF